MSSLTTIWTKVARTRAVAIDTPLTAFLADDLTDDRLQRSSSCELAGRTDREGRHGDSELHAGELEGQPA